MNHSIVAELVGTVHSVLVEVGDTVAAGDTVAILESMKMEIPILTEIDGVVTEVLVAAGDTLRDGDVLAVIGANT
jgi:acetyl-CoA carboxylase biotin carboxyl carrier protein